MRSGRRRRATGDGRRATGDGRRATASIAGLRSSPVTMPASPVRSAAPRATTPGAAGDIEHPLALLDLGEVAQWRNPLRAECRDEGRLVGLGAGCRDLKGLVACHGARVSCPPAVLCYGLTPVRVELRTVGAGPAGRPARPAGTAGGTATSVVHRGDHL